MVDHFEAFQKSSLHPKTANFSSLKWMANSSSRKILRLDFYSMNFYNSMRPHRKLYNLSPDDFERSFGLNGIQKCFITR